MTSTPSPRHPKRPGRGWIVAATALAALAAGAAPAHGADPLETLRVDGPIEGYVVDPLVSSGRAADVCATADRPGTMATFADLIARFGGEAGTMRLCREIEDDDRPGCDGQVIDPEAQPDFWSDCWSNHAQGRALDIMMDPDGCSLDCDLTRGIRIADLLLATDSAGNGHALARRMGVQLILFNNHCWNAGTQSDRAATGYAGMRACDVGHENHVHIDLTIAGADKRTSYWEAAPPPMPVPTGTTTGMTGAAGTGSIVGTVDLPTHTGAVRVRAVVDGVPQGDVPSAGGSGARSFTAPFTMSVTAAHSVCVQAYNGAVWTGIGGCLSTGQGVPTSLAGGPGSGQVRGVARIQGWNAPFGARALVNGVAQPAVSTSGGTGDQTYSAPFALTGAVSSKSVCVQGNSYGYWHPMGSCFWTAGGAFTAMTGTSGSGAATGVVTITGWSQGIQVRVTVDGVVDPNSYRYSSAGSGNRSYSAPFTASATTAHTVCVQANSYGYWTQLGCRTRPRA